MQQENINNRIWEYLDGRLTDEEKVRFESDCVTDPEVQSSVELALILRAVLKESGNVNPPKGFHESWAAALEPLPLSVNVLGAAGAATGAAGAVKLATTALKGAASTAKGASGILAKGAVSIAAKGGLALAGKVIAVTAAVVTGATVLTTTLLPAAAPIELAPLTDSKPGSSYSERMNPQLPPGSSPDRIIIPSTDVPMGDLIDPNAAVPGGLPAVPVNMPSRAGASAAALDNSTDGADEELTEEPTGEPEEPTTEEDALPPSAQLPPPGSVPPPPPEETRPTQLWLVVDAATSADLFDFLRDKNGYNISAQAQGYTAKCEYATALTQTEFNELLVSLSGFGAITNNTGLLGKAFEIYITVITPEETRPTQIWLTVSLENSGALLSFLQSGNGYTVSTQNELYIATRLYPSALTQPEFDALTSSLSGLGAITSDTGLLGKTFEIYITVTVPEETRPTQIWLTVSPQNSEALFDFLQSSSGYSISPEEDGYLAIRDYADALTQPEFDALTSSLGGFGIITDSTELLGRTLEIYITVSEPEEPQPTQLWLTVDAASENALLDFLQIDNGYAISMENEDCIATRVYSQALTQMEFDELISSLSSLGTITGRTNLLGNTIKIYITVTVPDVPTPAESHIWIEVNDAEYLSLRVALALQGNYVYSSDDSTATYTYDSMGVIRWKALLLVLDAFGDVTADARPSGNTVVIHIIRTTQNNLLNEASLMVGPDAECPEPDAELPADEPTVNADAPPAEAPDTAGEQLQPQPPETIQNVILETDI